VVSEIEQSLDHGHVLYGIKGVGGRYRWARARQCGAVSVRWLRTTGRHRSAAGARRPVRVERRQRARFWVVCVGRIGQGIPPDGQLYEQREQAGLLWQSVFGTGLYLTNGQSNRCAD